MFEKLMQARQQAEEVKKRLDNITVSGEVEAGKIKVTASASKQIKAITIDEAFLAETGKEELEELLLTAVNKALEQAENVSQSEMQAITKDMLGGLGGLFGK